MTRLKTYSTMKRIISSGVLALALAATACDEVEGPEPTQAEAAADGGEGASAPSAIAEEARQGDAASPQEDAASPELEREEVVASPDLQIMGRCHYHDLTYDALSCKTYYGALWTPSEMEGDCTTLGAGAATELTLEEGCDFEIEIGECRVFSNDGSGYGLRSASLNPAHCGDFEGRCSEVLGGDFEADNVCLDTVPPPENAFGATFFPPYESCIPPMEGEDAGNGPEGTVCTKVAIAGCTEPGRRYDDYATCNVVLTQRPYWPAPVALEVSEDDPRLADAEYMAEAAWVTEQAGACACTCCHSDSAPMGASNWNIDDGPFWFDAMSDDAVALSAGLADSSTFGAYPAKDNNGFSRDVTGIPTTDRERMVAFWVGELERRGLSSAWGESVSPFGGPIYGQTLFEPEACVGAQGVAADGSVIWSGGEARYVYVLEAGSANPGVPPNFDLPEGTIWRLDVHHQAEALSPGILYGEAPVGTMQRFPSEGAPASLEPGRDYYLYVLTDVGVPRTRCIFTAE